MTRKSKVQKTDINPDTGLPWRFRAPREMRVVSSAKSRNDDLDGKQRVPQIRLSGAWLERVGFRRGRRFLVLPDRSNQIVLAVID